MTFISLVGTMLSMKELLAYLNGLPLESRLSIAADCGTTWGYLRKACSAGQKLGPALSVAIERATGGAITRQTLHPDDWHLMWPELAQAAA